MRKDRFTSKKNSSLIGIISSSLLNKEAIIYLIIFFSALILRMINLGVVFTTDANLWLNCFQHFGNAIFNSDFASTYVTYHPGVISMWFASIILQKKGLIFPGPHPPPGDFVTPNPNLTPEIAECMRFYVYIPYLIISIIGILLVYYLIKRLFNNKRLSLLTSLFLAFSPSYIGYTRNYLDQDIILASFSIVSILCFLIYIKEERFKFLIFSGISFGLALLTKIPAVTIGITGAIILIFQKPLKLIKDKNPVKIFLSWVVTAAIIFIGLWPAMWVNPLNVILRLCQSAFCFAGLKHKIFFLGSIISVAELPGLIFYIVMISTKLTPIIFGFFIIFLFIVFRKRRFLDESKYLFLILLFVIVYIAIMSLGNIKYSWYILFLIPPITALSSFAIYYTVTKYIQKQLYQNAVFVLLILTQLLSSFSVFPYFGVYHSPLWGDHAYSSTLFGDYWGQGMEHVADYINAQPNAENLITATMRPKILYLMNKGQTVHIKHYRIADYVVFYKQQIDTKDYYEAFDFYIKNFQPVYIYSFKGVKVAYVFRNTPQILYKMGTKEISFPVHVGSNEVEEHWSHYWHDEGISKGPSMLYFRYFFWADTASSNIKVIFKIAGIDYKHKIIVNGRNTANILGATGEKDASYYNFEIDNKFIKQGLNDLLIVRQGPNNPLDKDDYIVYNVSFLQ